MARKKTDHTLSKKDIAALTANGCWAEDWNRVRVVGPLDADRFRNVYFSGDVSIGRQEKSVHLFGGIERKTGIYNAALHNCTVGNDVFINNVENYIANYEIDSDVIIDHVGMLAVEGESSFGNGVLVRVINETGGREIPIFDRLSSHLAYILALYRHRPAVVERLLALVADYTRSVTSSTGTIAAGARLIDCGTVRNVRVGAAAVLDRVSWLENGTVNSSPDDPTIVGTDVIARDFIFASGSKVTDNVILSHCFIGQGTELAKQYSAEHSVFFANCGGYHGEACSVFAGPYTVTHHKSTLLISGIYSFLNAGSGSNQSNHMYKLGPVHQGVVERGSKTTSDSYMLWPAKVGAFTLVMGRHYGNSDTSDLPFSYIIEHEDESICVPGVNLRSVGTIRDSRKWPLRDRRKDPDQLDCITFPLLTPYTVQKMLRGVRILEELKATSGQTSQHYYFNGVKIKRGSLDNGIRFYRLGIQRFVGNIVVKHLREHEYANLGELRKGLRVNTDRGRGRWLDLAGMLTTEEDTRELLDDIEAGRLNSLEKIHRRLHTLHEQFEERQWVWVIRQLEEAYHKKVEEFTVEDLEQVVRDWIRAVEDLDRLRCEDASKEFALTARIGFGIDGTQTERDADFEAIRGSAETNDFIVALRQRLEAKQKTATELIEKFWSF